MNTSNVDLIKHFEGCKLEAYQCPSGVWTIGYGHTRGVQEGDKITKKEADALLIEDVELVELHVDRLVKTELEQHQYDAIVSWCFNLGCGNLRASTLLLVLNSGELDAVSEQIVRWNKSKGKALAGLTRRRKSEATLFDTGKVDYGTKEKSND
jgi:lysozyme